jgi:hypothetical protein
MWSSQSVEQRLTDLATELAERTRAGAIEWRRSGTEKRYIFSGGEGSVSIEGPSEPYLRGGYVLRLLDAAGQEVEQLSGSPASGSINAVLATQALRDLFETVDQSNSRAMSLIDSILEDVRHR